MKTRTALDRDALVKGGRALAARTGATGVSLRDLGRELGVDHTALYRHVRSKDELMRILLDSVIQQAVDAVTADPQDWKQRLLQFAVAVRDAFIQYPAIGGDAVVLTTYGEGELNAMELMMSALHVAGLDGEELVRHYGLFSTYALARAAGISRSRAARHVAPGDTVPWMDAPIRAGAQHPLVDRWQGEILALVDDDLFEQGARTLIDAAERAAAAADARD